MLEKNTETAGRWKFCVAPMIDRTDRWCRHFHRLLSRRARLYTEMIAAPALLHGNVPRLLGFEQEALAIFLFGYLLGAVAFAHPDAVGEAVEIVLCQFLRRDDMVEDGGGQVVEMHTSGSHLVVEVFLFGSDEAVAFAAQFYIEKSDGVEDAFSVAGVASTRVGAAAKGRGLSPR